MTGARSSTSTRRRTDFTAGSEKRKLKGELIMGVVFYVQRTLRNGQLRGQKEGGDRIDFGDGCTLSVQKEDGGFPTMTEVIKGLEANGQKEIKITARTWAKNQKLKIIYQLQEQPQDGRLMRNLKWAGKAAIKTGVTAGATLMTGPYGGMATKVGLDAMQSGGEAYYEIWYTPVDFKITSADGPAQLELPKQAYKLNQVATEIRTKFGFGWRNGVNAGMDAGLGAGVGFGLERGATLVANSLDPTGLTGMAVSGAVQYAGETGTGFAGDYVGDSVSDLIKWMIPERLSSWWSG
jgi:hypothetical protein